MVGTRDSVETEFCGPECCGGIDVFPLTGMLKKAIPF
jgi:hypothetical protein